MVKRVFDILLTCVVLPVVGPVAALVALALKIQGRGSVLHWTPRMGRGGAVFYLARFRTMVDAPPEASVAERLTPVGRFIRNYSLDDLPHLYHVVRGDMSLVGPRPMEAHLVDPTDPTWQRILSVRPGCVSYAILTLASRYNASSMAERQRLELEYVERQSFLVDLAIIRDAIRALVASKGNIKARGTPTA